MKILVAFLLRHRRIIFLISGSALVGIMLLGNIPMWYEYGVVEAQYKITKYEADEQEILQPLYKQIAAEKRKILPRGTPMPDFSKKGAMTIVELVEVLKSMGRQVGLRTVDITPYPDSFKSGVDTFTIGCRVEGNYMYLQSFLLKINTIASLYGVDEMQVVATRRGVACVLNLRFTVGA